MAYGSIVVIGGGCYGSYYVRQLARARESGALTWQRLLVVDRNPGCRVTTIPHPPALELVPASWAEFLREFLGRGAPLAAAKTTGGVGPPRAVPHGHLTPADDASAPDTAADTIVPSPLMPHLLFEWLVERARERVGADRASVRPLRRAPAVPWERAAADGSAHYVSFAEWMCPINCIEPARCPATRGSRDWTMPAALAAHVESERAAGHNLAGPLVFHCTHRAFGVGMIDVADVLDADRRIAAARAPAEFLVGTVSHCHGALGVLAIGS